MDQLILRLTTKLLFAPIILFAFYVQFHGDYGPGGGVPGGCNFRRRVHLALNVFWVERNEKNAASKCIDCRHGHWRALLCRDRCRHYAARRQLSWLR